MKAIFLNAPIPQLKGWRGYARPDQKGTKLTEVVCIYFLRNTCLCGLCMERAYIHMFAHTDKWGWKSTNKGRDAVEPSLDTGHAHQWPSGMANRRGGLRGFLPNNGTCTLIVMCLGVSVFVLRGRAYTGVRGGSGLQ